MENKNKVSIYNRLFFKLYINYILMLLVTIILTCLIFINLYKNAIKRKHENQLERQALTVAERMTEFVKYNKYDNFFEYHNILEEIDNLDIWTISNPNANNPMDIRLETTSFDEISESEKHTAIIEEVFNNKTMIVTDYDEIYGLPMTTMAAPIIGDNREVVGAVILMSTVEGQKDIVSDSVDLIIKSSIVSMAISFIVIIVLARRLSIPISKMRLTSLELSSGNYNAKTNINRKDEIGDLANSIDILSDKLLFNEVYRREQEQIRQDFFANVSHELRTPITVIRAYTETLVDGVETDEKKIQQYYNRMLNECRNMERLVGDLMLLSKMQNPDFAIDKEQVNIIQIFDDIIRTTNVMVDKKGINILLKKDSDICMMLGDYGRLRQMFMVIIDNALKFSEKGKNIYIEITSQDKIVVSIRDEGMGILPEELDNIFDKFYKSNIRQNASGTGLGLAIANQISLKHDGEIEVYSQINKGTEFIFAFPKLEKLVQGDII